MSWSNDPLGGCGLRCCRGELTLATRRLPIPGLEHSADGGAAEVQACPGQNLCELGLAKGRAQGFESLDDMADEVRELVDRLPELHQGRAAVLVDPSQPGCDRLGLDEECAGSLGKRPPSGSLQLEDGHSLDSGVVRTALWVGLGEPSILDAELLTEPSYLLPELVVVSSRAHRRVDAVGSPAAGCHHGVLG